MKLLFVGDVIGRPGRRIVQHRLQDLVSAEEAELVILNCENSAAGFGVTPDIAESFLDLGVDVLTSGNHIWDKKQIFDYFAQQPRLLRPANYPEAPGTGVYVGCTGRGTPYAVLNLQGRTYMPATHCPFRMADEILESIEDDVKVRFVDFHAEATSEKQAMGWHLDGKVSAIVGTHTHVPTADSWVLPQGTAYQTDVGMTGPIHSVIGMDVRGSVGRFLNARPARFEPASGPVRMNAVLIDVDERTGKARSIERRTGDLE